MITNIRNKRRNGSILKYLDEFTLKHPSEKLHNPRTNGNIFVLETNNFREFELYSSKFGKKEKSDMIFTVYLFKEVFEIMKENRILFEPKYFFAVSAINYIIVNFNKGSYERIYTTSNINLNESYILDEILLFRLYKKFGVKLEQKYSNYDEHLEEIIEYADLRLEKGLSRKEIKEIMLTTYTTSLNPKTTLETISRNVSNSKPLGKGIIKKGRKNILLMGHGNEHSWNKVTRLYGSLINKLNNEKVNYVTFDIDPKTKPDIIGNYFLTSSLEKLSLQKWDYILPVYAPIYGTLVEFQLFLRFCKYLLERNGELIIPNFLASKALNVRNVDKKLIPELYSMNLYSEIEENLQSICDEEYFNYSVDDTNVTFTHMK